MANYNGDGVPLILWILTIAFPPLFILVILYAIIADWFNGTGGKRNT